MSTTGILRKMHVHLPGPEGVQEVAYSLRLGDERVPLNAHIGTDITLSYTGRIFCVSCGRKTNKSFAQGFCYPCFRDSPDNAECIIRPELCEGHEGRGRDPAWEAEHHVQPHLVYLALTSGLKVGVTRFDQVPTRWIDQGAWAAIRLADTPHRQLAGAIEVAMKEHVADRTAWQRMLKATEPPAVDLVAEKQRLAALLPPELQTYRAADDSIWQIRFPLQTPPAKVKSQTLDKHPKVSGRLAGIRGQYLIFDDDRVMNIRRHSGYEVSFESEGPVD